MLRVCKNSLLVFFFMALFLPRSWAEKVPVLTYQDTLVLSTASDPKTFNPITSQDAGSRAILELVFEGLTGTDPETGEVIPQLAKSWEHDDSGQTWTVHLRRDVLWSDGAPFTAEDVVFTFTELIYNPEVLTSARSIFLINGEPIEVSIIDDYTVEFLLPSPFAPFLRALSQEILPAHLLQPIVAAGKFNEAWGIDWPLETVVGTGPFRFLNYESGEKIVLEKNQYYWKKNAGGQSLPKLSHVVFEVIPNPELALLKFKNGQLDVYGLRGPDFPWLKPLEKQKDFTIYELGPGLGTSFLAFNQNLRSHALTGKPFVTPYKQRWFTNRLFRQAVAYALDQEQITALVFQGKGTVQFAAISEASGFFHNPFVRRYGFDPDKARMLLKEAGYEDQDQDGILEDDLGKKMRFTLLLAAQGDQQVQMANLIRKDLSAIGLEVQIEQVEFNTLVTKLTATFDWEMVLIGLTGTLEPHFGANVWLSHAPLHLWNPVEPEPATAWERRVDEIFDSGVKLLDQQQRKKLYDEFQEIIAEEVPVIYTAGLDRLIAVSNRLANIKPTKFGGVLHNMEEIEIKGQAYHAN